MVRPKSIFVCVQCRHESIKWQGKCPSCQEWNSFCEHFKEIKTKIKKTKAVSLSEVKETCIERNKTGVAELDEVLGGGVVDTALILIAGRPGVGKSSLLTILSGKLASLYPTDKILYVSGEESQIQLVNRFRRFNIISNNIFILTEQSWESIRDTLEELKPKYLIIDSVQTLRSLDSTSSLGSSAQIKEAVTNLLEYLNQQKTSCFMLGHINKNGEIAGPKYLEHMVDVVLHFEGSPETNIRTLMPLKNRYGSTLIRKNLFLGENA